MDHKDGFGLLCFITKATEDESTAVGEIDVRTGVWFLMTLKV